jgi:hypothetical protein
VAVNAPSAELSGISTNKVLAVGWGLAAVAGAVAGLMAAPIVFLEPSMMMGPLIYALAGALLGGIASPVGAVAGGRRRGTGEPAGRLRGRQRPETDLHHAVDHRDAGLAARRYLRQDGPGEV